MQLNWIVLIIQFCAIEYIKIRFIGLNNKRSNWHRFWLLYTICWNLWDAFHGVLSELRAKPIFADTVIFWSYKWNYRLCRALWNYPSVAYTGQYWTCTYTWTSSITRESRTIMLRTTDRQPVCNKNDGARANGSAFFMLFDGEKVLSSTKLDIRESWNLIQLPGIFIKTPVLRIPSSFHLQYLHLHFQVLFFFNIMQQIWLISRWTRNKSVR